MNGRKLLVLCLFVGFGFSSLNAISATTSIEINQSKEKEAEWISNEPRSFEYLRQVFMKAELPIFSLHAIRSLAVSPVADLAKAGVRSDIFSRMLGTLGFLDISAFTHVGLLASSELERMAMGSNATRLVIPSDSKSPNVDMFLEAQRQYTFAIYGVLALALKVSGAEAADAPFKLLVDQYFSLDHLAMNAANLVRLRDNNNTALPTNTYDVPSVAPLSNLDAFGSVGNVANIGLSLAQVFAYANYVGASNRPQALASLQSVSRVRGYFIFTFLGWLGLNNLPFLFDQVLSAGSKVVSLRLTSTPAEVVQTISLPDIDDNKKKEL